MPRRSTASEVAAALAAAGFHRHDAAGGTAGERAVFRRPAQGRWVLEARHDGGHVDVGLTLEDAGGVLIGPVHRALSPAALASALPHITASLESLAAAAESLRCPKCNAWAVRKEGEDGPFLACGQPKGRKPFSRGVTRCRRSLVMSALIVYREPKSQW